LKKLEGNPGRRNLEKEEASTPQPKAVTFIETPEIFAGDSGRSALWGAVCKELREINVLHTCDRFALERYVELLARWRECQQYLQVECGGRTSYQVEKVGRNGEETGVFHWKMYPEVKLLRELSTDLLRIEQQFGLTPSGRTRILGEGVGGSLPGEKPAGGAAEGESDDDDEFADCND